MYFMLTFFKYYLFNFFLVFSFVDSDKYHEISAAVAEPPKDGFRLDDDSEFPPV